MTVTATGGTNAANLALFMVNLSTVLLRTVRETDPACSVLDLKAAYRGGQGWARNNKNAGATAGRAFN